MEMVNYIIFGGWYSPLYAKFTMYSHLTNNSIQWTSESHEEAPLYLHTYRSYRENRQADSWEDGTNGLVLSYICAWTPR